MGSRAHSYLAQPEQDKLIVLSFSRNGPANLLVWIVNFLLSDSWNKGFAHPHWDFVTLYLPDCACYEEGSKSTRCDSVSLECDCRNKFTGPQCDQCQVLGVFWWKFQEFSRGFYGILNAASLITSFHYNTGRVL